MRAVPAAEEVEHRDRRSLRSALTLGAVVTFAGAVGVVVFGVVVTSGVYGSRMAWLLGAALPLLAATAVLSGLALRTSRRGDRTPAPRPAGADPRRLLLWSALVLFGIPLALAVLLVVSYGFIFVLHGVGLLR
jgi:hypothetical protein